MNNFCRKLCYCFFPSNSTVPLVEEIELSKKDHLPSETASEDDLFPRSLYRDDELNVITYSKKRIIQFIESEFDMEATKETYKEFSNRDGMIFASKEVGSIITSKFPLIRFTYSISKADLPNGFTLKQLANYITGNTKRGEWDQSFKEYKVIEEKDGYCVLHTWNKSPIMLISERDTVDKKADFYHEGEFYSFSSSVNDNYIPQIQDVVRITDYLFIYNIKEDQNGFHIKSLSQMDVKMNIPPTLLKGTVPTKMSEWFKKLKATIKQDEQDGKL